MLPVLTLPTPDHRAALELVEEAREQEGGGGGFARGLFLGSPAWASLFPYPLQTTADREHGQPFLSALEDLLRRQADPDAIDATAEIPPELMTSLRGIGAFGIKVPADYGGLGLSETNYLRAFVLLGSHCANLTTLLSVHQSVGAPQPLLLFGNEEQKRRYLPRLAAGDLSAFALTETKVGSDPARMECRADPAPDGRHYLLNGEKLWCSNGPIAKILVVAARTPPLPGDAPDKRRISTFIVEAGWPGVSVAHRCHFMGLKALQNGVLRFEGVRVPRENLLAGEGEGLKVALSALNTGRLAVAASSLGMAKSALAAARRWCREREQWGAPIGRHGMVAARLSSMAASVFSMEAMLFHAAALDDAGADVRLEAALAKIWCSERAWDVVNDALQIRGGRGYETASSLRARGEDPAPIERWVRDNRIATVFEGSSEILRLFAAREALEGHFRRVGVAPGRSTDPPQDWARRILPCAAWYLRTFLPRFAPPADALLRGHLRFVESASRRLARGLFTSLIRHREGLERQQLLLKRQVDAGLELQAMAACCAYALALGHDPRRPAASELANLFCASARLRARALLRRPPRGELKLALEGADRTMRADWLWLEEGRLDPGGKGLG